MTHQTPSKGKEQSEPGENHERRSNGGHRSRGGRRRFIDAGPAHRTARYYVKDTGHGTLHVNIVDDAHGPYRVFVNLPPIGTEISGLASVIGVLLSKYLENGGGPERILKHLRSVKGDRPFGYGLNRVDSIPHGLALILEEHLRATGRLSDPAQGGKDPAIG